jgi:hypothetical protein
MALGLIDVRLDAAIACSVGPWNPFPASKLVYEEVERKNIMKWVLVVLIGGVAPVTTDVTFEKLSDCLAAEQQLRQTYVDALDAWNREVDTVDRTDRRRGRRYHKARELEARKFANAGTCVPHAGTDQPITSLNRNEHPDSSSTPTPTPSTTTQ